MSEQLDEKVVTPYTLRKIDGYWVAHALAFDVVATGDTTQEAMGSLDASVSAYIGWRIRRGGTLRDCYFAAPPRYWEAPISEITVSWKDVKFE